MTPQQNEEIIKKYFEEAWNRGNLDVLDEIIAPNYLNHSPGMPNPPPGPEGLKPIIRGLRKAFPDLHFTIENMVVTAHQVAIHSIMHGTHQGDLFGLPPTGKKVKVNQMQIERIVDGKIVEHWRQSDDLGMMKQLGQIP
ncbi:MAG: ester cyclase [Chlamydiota bacterium]